MSTVNWPHRTDGVQIATFSTSKFYFGSETNGQRPAEAAFDEFRISTRARTGAEILNSFERITDATSLLSPRGLLESITNNVITGWAYQADQSATSLNIQFRIDGALVDTQPANLAHRYQCPVRH